MAGEKINKPRARASRDGTSLELISPREPAARADADPDEITDDVRRSWKSTRIAGETLNLLDGDGNTILTLPFTDANLHHYMGGPEQNAAAAEARELEALNTMRREQGIPELESHDQIEQEERVARVARKRTGKNMRYTEKEADRIKHNMRFRLDNTTLDDARKREILGRIDRVSDSESARVVKEMLDNLSPEKPARSRRSASERTEIPQDSAAFENKKRELKSVLQTALENKELSADHVNTFNNAIDSTRFIQELPGIEADIAQRVSEARAPEAEAQSADEPKANENIDDLLKKLASRTKEERTRAMRQNARQPERANRARPSHQELHDLLTGAGDAAPESAPDSVDHSEQPESHNADDQPNQPPTEALRRSVGGSHHGNEAHGDAPENKYKIDQRNYLGLDIMSVQSIIHDPVHQQFFGELVHTIAPEAGQVILRYKEGGATPEDMSLMKYAAYEYSKWNRAWEELVAHLTDVDVDTFMRRNEMLDNIAAHVGGTRGKEVLAQTLRFTAMRDQKTFESIEHAVHEMHEVRDSYLGRKAEGKIQALADRVGIDRSDFETVFDFSTPETERETHRHLVELFQRKAGTGRKVMDSLSRKWFTPLAGSSEIAADNAIRDAKAALSGRFGRTGKKLDHLGDTLEHASHDLSKVVGTQEVIDQVTQETVTNERMRMGSEAGPASFAEAQQKAAEITPPALEKIISDKIASDPNWARGTPAYRQTEIQKMKQAGEKSLNAGTGFWSWLVRMIFASKFDKAATAAQRNAGAVH